MERLFLEFTKPVIHSQKFGFTLAEVLITLGIIGVVAAMTMPSLIQNHKYQVLHTQFKKAYADLNQASKLFQLHNDMTVSEYAANTSTKKALQAFQKEFNLLNTSNLTWTSTDEDGNAKTTPYGNWKIIGKSTTMGSICDNSGYFWDVQNRLIAFDDTPNSGDNGPKVCIDINGAKGPNTYGLDYFVFIFTIDGNLIPWGQPHPNNPTCTTIYNNCTPSSLQAYCNYGTRDIYTCSYYALSDQHPKTAGKTYWKDFVKGN